MKNKKEGQQEGEMKWLEEGKKEVEKEKRKREELGKNEERKRQKQEGGDWLPFGMKVFAAFAICQVWIDFS